MKNSIEKIKFPDEQYHKIETKKQQIVLHHTVSGAGIEGDLSSWLGDKLRIATHFIIARDGKIFQCFDEKYWGSHIGCKIDVFKSNKIPIKLRKNSAGVDFIANNTILDEQSISIEIDSYGPLIKSYNDYLTYYKTKLNKGLLVHEYKSVVKGYNYYEAYTQNQISSLKDLLQYLCKNHNIKTDYNEDIWDVNKRALSGENGIFTHVSYRIDKSDCHPQPLLINMLKSL